MGKQLRIAATAEKFRNYHCQHRLVLCGCSYNLLDTYLQYLSQDDKEKLKELGIIIHSPTFKRRLFNYPGFIKVLNITRVEVHIVNWVNNRFIPRPFRGIKSKKITFLEKHEELTLNSSFDDYRLSHDELQPYLTSLPLSSTIKHLKIHINSSRQSLTNLIQSQSQLLSLTIYNTPISIEHLSNSLISIKFENCNFADTNSFDSFKSLKQLRSLQFINCIGLTIQNFQPLLNDPSPLKLRSLKGVGLFPGIAILIQLVGPYLEYLELTFLEDPARNVALESIIKHCHKIIFLSLSCFDEKDAHLCNKIIHMNNHLRYLTIEKEPFSYNRTDSGLLKKLKILQNKLDYLNLKFTFDPNDLKLFLDNCNHLVGLKNLLVRNDSCYDGIDTFKLLKKFVKENKVNNFAYQVETFFDPKNSRHHYLERLAG
ncbi:11775_t:CDS:2 [Funneliformis mosseae]|uniref:11775_t:CDS:1 n=1 Tax=Funneliformis mosseae TaxID=27381 RepID=A0A9N9BYX4_FUNMO|nr:11775_t:CDS:2 [Funneliformis mosseae]